MAGKPKKGDDEKGGGKSKLKPILAIVAAAVAYKFVLAPKPASAPQATAAAAAAKAPEEGLVASLPELVLNLAGTEPHYLRVGAALVLEKGVDPAKLKDELPLASDVLVDVLSAKTPAQLREANSKTELKKELSEKVRAAFHDEKVVRVIFTTFVMQ